MNIREIEITYKCCVCGEDISVNLETIGEAVYCDKKIYHSDCFAEMAEKRAKSKNKKISDKWKFILADIGKVRKESYIYFKNRLYKAAVCQFIEDNYYIKVIPRSIHIRLGDIYNGSYIRLPRGIPPSHILDMWERKRDFLNRVYENNISKGKCMDVYERILYDLGVLANSYDSYLKWREKQKKISAEMKNNPQKQNTEIYKFMESLSPESTDISQKHFDMSALADEIFDG